MLKGKRPRMADKAGFGHARWWGAVFLAAGLALASVFLASCETVQVGVTKEYTVDESLGSAAVTDIELVMGAGKLTISPGAPGLASGVIRCNVEGWAPKTTRTDTKLTIEQGRDKRLSGFESKTVNEWRLELGRAPIRLKVDAGAYTGYYDLSGLTLVGLRIKDGAADTKVMFNAPNPGQMDSLKYETGASTVTLIGLANANCKSMWFKAGAGSYTLDFSGQLRSDCSVQVEAGAGTVKIVVPNTTAARVSVEGSLTRVTTTGPWNISRDVYATGAVSGPTPGKLLAISVKMDVGSLNLVAE